MENEIKEIEQRTVEIDILHLKIRKLFSILLYLIAGLFFTTNIISILYLNPFYSSDVLVITLLVLLALSSIFILFASLLYPNKDWYKPIYITILTSTVLAVLGSVSQYSMVKDFINIPITGAITGTILPYNLPLGISVSIVFLLMALYFYFHSEKLSTGKRWSPFFIAFTVVFFVIYALIKLLVSDDQNGEFNIYNFNATTYINLIQDHVDNNESNELIAILASVGYDNYLDDKDEFISYDNSIMALFYKNIQKGKSAVLNTNMWVSMFQDNNFTQDKFDVFFKQLEKLDVSEKDKNTTWGILSKELPGKYLDYMDRQLESISLTNVVVPLVKLYKKDGSTVEDINLSRAYLISEVYRRMSEFCNDASSVFCDAEEYARKAWECCSLNPSALFRYAYESDETTLRIGLLEDILKLIKVSEALFDTRKDALYNNLGYNIYLDGQVSKYDDALVYLKKAYELNNESVYSLSPMSGIYRDRKDYKSAYNIMEHEVYKFLHASNDELLEKEINYWDFARTIISTSYEFKDYNTTNYTCGRYLKLYDPEYEDCHKYMKEIEQLSDNGIMPIYSFWRLYTEPEIFNAVKTNKEVKGLLACGSFMSYADSLKYKSTSRQQTNLLEKFVTLYAPHTVPNTLKELIKIEEKLGVDSYVISFYLDPENREEFFQSTFSYEDKALNKKVAKYFLPLAHIDGTGANAALWAVDGNETDLENAPIVEFGSEGQIDIVAKNLKDFIYMLSFGIEPMDGEYMQFLSINEENYRRENFEVYRKWLKETMNIEPVKDLEVWGTPKKVEALHEEARTLYSDRLFQWLYTLLPNHGTVEEGKQVADKFTILVQEKKRLMALIDENTTSDTYRLLARNEQGLRDIDRSLIENVSDYYKQAFELEHNKSIIEEWALFRSGFSDKEEIKNDEDKANFYISFPEIYSELGNETKAKAYLELALKLYKKSANDEENSVKKMRLYEEIADIYKDTNQSTTAINYYKKALEVKVDDKLWLKKYYYVDLAEIYEEQKEYLLAIENYKKALSIVDKKKQKTLYNYYIADNYKALGDLA